MVIEFEKPSKAVLQLIFAIKSIGKRGRESVGNSRTLAPRHRIRSDPFKSGP
jgi:hypothetical protein